MLKVVNNTTVVWRKYILTLKSYDQSDDGHELAETCRCTLIRIYFLHTTVVLLTTFNTYISTRTTGMTFLKIFPHYFINGKIFEKKKVYWTQNVCFNFFCNFGLKNFSFPAARTVHTHTTGSKLGCQTQTKYTTKFLWITTSNFRQAQLCTPWWWVT